MEFVCVALVALFIFSLLSEKPDSSKTVEEIGNSVIAVTDVSALNKCQNSTFKKEFSLNPNDFDGVFYYASDSLMEVREVLVVKLADPSQEEVLTDSIKKRIEDKIVLFSGYAPQEEALLNSYVLECSRGVVLFAVCDNPEQVVQSFKDSL